MNFLYHKQLLWVVKYLPIFPQYQIPRYHTIERSKTFNMSYITPYYVMYLACSSRNGKYHNFCAWIFCASLQNRTDTSWMKRCFATCLGWFRAIFESINAINRFISPKTVIKRVNLVVEKCRKHQFVAENSCAIDCCIRFHRPASLWANVF